MSEVFRRQPRNSQAEANDIDLGNRHDCCDEDCDHERRRSLTRWKFFPALALLISVLFGAVVLRSLRFEKINVLNASSASDNGIFSSKETELKNCSLSFQPTQRKEWTTKPIWVPSFPNAGGSSPSNKGDLVRPIVNLLTGFAKGGKNFYASSKALKRCQGLGESVTCTNVHPIVNMNNLQSLKNLFHPSKIILPIRSPKTNFLAHLNDKALAYRNRPNQVPESEWRTFRDEFLDKTMFEQWKSVIPTWKNAGYSVALYLPYEHLMDPKKGPALLERLSTVLQEAGFPTATSSEDFQCIWYQVIPLEKQRLQEFYSDYEPGFTTKQRDFLIQGLKDLIQEMKDDQDLASILEEYILELKENTRIDE